jgi:hypothetical protein
MYFKIIFLLGQFVKKLYNQIVWLLVKVVYMFFRALGDIDSMEISHIFVKEFPSFVVASARCFI